MKYSPINFSEKLSKFNEHWSPKVIAAMNDYELKVVKVFGDFTWHKHQDTDETFIVLDGELVIHFRDGKVPLKQGEMFVVPKGFEHKPYAEKECKILIIEPNGVKNTGDSDSHLAANDEWI